MKKIKWYIKAIVLFLNILLSPIIIIVMLFSYMIGKITERKTQKTIEKNNLSKKQRINTSMPEPKACVSQNDDEFIAHFHEFLIVEYYAFNGLTDEQQKRKLIASKAPEIKEQILSFVEHYPIINLLQGDRYSDGYDLDHWEITFIFEDSRLNRCISGYGTTDCTCPYLIEMVNYLPESLNE